ncbi:MAG: methyltransferase domain-containing protein [Bacteroidota bacterium]
MKTNNPNSRFKLSINSRDRVLEIGGGHNPHPRANVVVDKYILNDGHRSGNLNILPHQKFVNADGENLPFEDNVFDYVICCHVLEHVENPAKFLKEMTRVAKRGYIEVPSLLGEYLAPKASHRWISIEKDNKIVICSKEKLGMQTPTMDAGDVFLYHLPKNSLAYKALIKTHGNLLTLRYEWENEIDFEIDPETTTLPLTESGRWLPEMIRQTFPERSIKKEILGFSKALWEVGTEYLKNRMKGKERTQTDTKIGLGIPISS